MPHPKKHILQQELVSAKKQKQTDAIGPVQVELLGAMSAMDAWSLAREERDKTELASQDVDASTHHSIVTQLFEMAVQEFQKDLSQDNKVAYASCLFDLGMHVQDAASLILSISEFIAHLRAEDDAAVWLRMGRAQLCLANMYAEKNSPDSDAGEQSVSELPLAEKELLDEGIASLNTVPIIDIGSETGKFSFK